MVDTVTITRRFCGPPGSGNGGYTTGLVAAALSGAPAVEVTLHRPPPLERPLQLAREGDGATLHDGDDLVARGTVCELELEPPAAPTADELAAAVASFDVDQYAADHAFAGCFTCGPARDDGDGLRLFPAPLARDALHVWSWTPGPQDVEQDGSVSTPIAWAALDCPGGLAWMTHDDVPAVLGRLRVAVRRTPTEAEPLVVGGWRIAEEGRKRHSGSVIWSAEGEVLAVGEAVWIVLTAEQQAAFGVAGSGGAGG